MQHVILDKQKNYTFSKIHKLKYIIPYNLLSNIINVTIV